MRRRPGRGRPDAAEGRRGTTGAGGHLSNGGAREVRRRRRPRNGSLTLFDTRGRERERERERVEIMMKIKVWPPQMRRMGRTIMGKFWGRAGRKLDTTRCTVSYYFTRIEALTTWDSVD